MQFGLFLVLHFAGGGYTLLVIRLIGSLNGRKTVNGYLFCQALKRATDGTQRSVENLFAESSLVRKVHKLKDDRK